MTKQTYALKTYETQFEHANNLLNARQYEEAKKAYEQAYAIAPNWRTAYGLGLSCAHLGQSADAIRYYQEATLHDPCAIEPRVNLANLLRDRGELAEARFHHLVAYSINPNHPLTTLAVAIAMERNGDVAIARELYQRCIRLDSSLESAWRALATLPTPPKQPDLPPSLEDLKAYQEALAWGPERRAEAIEILERVVQRGVAHSVMMVDLGNLYLADGRVDDAVAMQHRAIAENFLLASAFHNLGAALQSGGRLDEAAIAYERAAALAPQLAQCWLNYGRTLTAKGRLDRACDCFLRAEALSPESPDATIEFANVAQRLRRTNEVVAAMQRLREKHPENFMVVNNLGAIFLDMQRLDDAEACFNDAARLDPTSAMVQSNLGAVNELRGDFEKALEGYQRARELMPDSSSILARILHVSQHQCDWQGIEDLFSETVRLARSGKFEGVNPFSLITVPGIDRFDQLACAKAFTEVRLGYLKPMALPPVQPSERRSSRRIRVGYLSSDLYDHATSWLIAEVIELHDRDKFEIIAYSYGPGYETPTRARLRKSFDRFAELRDVSDEQAAHMIRTDEVDVLIDLKGYTQSCRTGIVALKPAPVQVNYLGFPGTLGADFIDYIVADATIIPEEFADGYSEKVLRLPHCYQPNDRKRPLPAAPSRAEAGLPEDAFVFCSFNNVYKVIPEVFDVWCQLLRETPDSVLWVLSSAGAFANLQREAESRGVAAERLLLAPRVGLADHIARFRCADLFLDTFPCAAHTTASDSLWAGVPLVTMVGDTFASRVAASLLKAAGMPELVAANLDEYYEIAQGLATDVDRTRGLKAKLEAERMTSPVFDSAAYTRDLEALFASAFDDWRRSGA
jgi:protein O-GlcNAc transferase